MILDKPKDPDQVDSDALRHVIRAIQRELWMTRNGWDRNKEWPTDVAEAVAEALAKYGLSPTVDQGEHTRYSVRCVVACRAEDNSPVLFPCTVKVTKAEFESLEADDMAAEQAADAGYNMKDHLLYYEEDGGETKWIFESLFT